MAIRTENCTSIFASFESPEIFSLLQSANDSDWIAADSFNALLARRGRLALNSGRTAWINRFVHPRRKAWCHMIGKDAQFWPRAARVIGSSRFHMSLLPIICKVATCWLLLARVTRNRWWCDIATVECPECPILPKVAYIACICIIGFSNRRFHWKTAYKARMEKLWISYFERIGRGTCGGE